MVGPLGVAPKVSQVPSVPEPLLPDYGGACLSSVVPALMASDRSRFGTWLPELARDAAQVVLLVLDGLGWRQLQERPSLAPTLVAMEGGAITSVAPTTTATALSSIVTGATPAEHGILGFKLHLGAGEVLNVLKWTTAAGDARDAYPPEQFRVIAPFAGKEVTTVVRSEFATTGFTRALLGGARFSGWRVLSTLVVEVRRALQAGEPFVYCYYDGVDNVAHQFGLGEHYEAEVIATDALVASLLDVLPDGAALVVTSDHGQVDCGGRRTTLARDVARMTSLLSGEPRFLWLHAAPGVDPKELADAAREAHGHEAWVRTREETVEEGWFGGSVRAVWQERLGDVAVVAHEPTAFWDTDLQGELRLVSLHGSLTPQEVEVPLVAARR